MSNETDYIITQKYHSITRQLTIYAGIILHTLCVFGTIMNIVAFSRATYRRRASSFYLLYASIFDFVHLFPKSLLNILQYGFYYDWTMNSVFLRKIKIYFVYVFTITSGTLTVLASIDRFLLSSNNSKRWNYTSRSFATRAIKLTILFWFIVSIPIYICSNSTYLFLRWIYSSIYYDDVWFDDI